MIYAWCVTKDGQFNEQEAIIGQTIEVPKNQVGLFDLNSLFGYINLLYALEASTKLYLVELGEEMNVSDNNHLVIRLKILAMANIELIPYRFSLWCAEQTLALVENPDPRSLAALEAKRLWLATKVSYEEMQIVVEAAQEATQEATLIARAANTPDAVALAAWAALAANTTGAVASADLAAWAARIAAGVTGTGTNNMKAAAYIAARANQKAKLIEMILSLPEFDPFKGLFLP